MRSLLLRARGRVAGGGDPDGTGFIAGGRLRRVSRGVRPAAVGLACAGLLGAGLAGLGPASPARAAYLGSDGRIVFVRNGNIYTIKPGGTGLRKLTSGGGDAGPRWSPDGKQIAYLDHGNLRIMRAGGGGKRQVTRAAPGFTDARPSWSPNGRYLAFVRIARHASHGYLTRYDTVTHRFAAFTTMFDGGTVDVAALPTAVAWAAALNAGGTLGYFIAYEGAADECSGLTHCLDLLGLTSQSQYRNGFPSLEEGSHGATRLLDPDWYPIRTEFSRSLLVTNEHCAAGHCTHQGIEIFLGTPVLPGAYQAVFSPLGDHIAYVRNVRGVPHVYVTVPGFAAPTGSGTLLTSGSEPDWQPVAPFPPA